MTGNEPIPGQYASKKSHFRQGSFAETKGLTGNKPIPGRGASRKSHFWQGSFADGKGRPIPGRGTKQKSHLRQGLFAEGKGPTTPIQNPTCKEQILMCHKKKRYETCPKRRKLRNWSRSRRCQILCRSLTETDRFEQLVGGTPRARPPQEELLLKMHQAQTRTNAQGANLYVPQAEMVRNVPKRAKNWENGAGPSAAKFFV